MNNPGWAQKVEDHHTDLAAMMDMAMEERLNLGKGLIWALLLSFPLWLMLVTSLAVLL